MWYQEKFLCACIFASFQYKLGHVKASLHIVDVETKRIGELIKGATFLNISYLQYKIYKKTLANKNSET